MINRDNIPILGPHSFRAYGIADGRDYSKVPETETDCNWSPKHMVTEVLYKTYL